MKNIGKTLLITLVIAMLAGIVYTPSIEGKGIPQLSTASEQPTISTYTEALNQCNVSCAEHGFDFGIARWNWNNGQEQYVLAVQRPTYSTSVSGSQSSADWTSVADAAGVITHEGDHSEFDFAGGPSGTVTQTGETGIRSVVLCGNYNQVPEFTPIAGLIAVSGSVLAFFVIRRK